MTSLIANGIHFSEKNKNAQSKSMGHSESEQERIVRVYESYRLDASTSDSWNFSNRGNQQILVERNRVLGSILRSAPGKDLQERQILDLGCGSGAQLAALQDYGAQASNLFGVDLVASRIEEARRRYPFISFTCCNAEYLPFEDGRFDMVLLFTVFSSVLDIEMRRALVAEITRVLGSDGFVVWYDIRYNNPKNSDVRRVSRRELKDLFPQYVLNIRTLTVVPPLARKLGSWTSLAYPVLNLFPFLRSHYFGLIQKKS